MEQSQTHQSILLEAKSGNPLAWQRLTELYRPFIAGWARRHTAVPQDSEDLAQEILTEVVRSLPRFEHNNRPGAFRCWLRTIAARTTGHFLSTCGHQPRGTGDSNIQASLLELEDSESGLSKEWDREHNQFVVARLLDQVAVEFEPQSVTAFRRHTLDSTRADAVGKELNMSVAAVYTAKSRILHRLRQMSEGLVDWSE